MTREERKHRRLVMARAVAGGASLLTVAATFAVDVRTVRNSCDENAELFTPGRVGQAPVVVTVNTCGIHFRKGRPPRVSRVVDGVELWPCHGPCGRELPRDAYHPYRDRPDAVRRRCRQCEGAHTYARRRASERQAQGEVVHA